MSDNNLDTEIEQWLEVVTKNPELAISPLESDVIKGDIDGHEFHGNQWSQGAGGATPPRRIDPNRYGHPASEEEGHKFNGSQWVAPPSPEPMPDSKEITGPTVDILDRPNWGDENNSEKALADVKAADYSASWENYPMTDTAAKVMEAESRHPDMEAAYQGKETMSNDERSADSIPKWLVDKATKDDLDVLTDHNFHSSVRYITSQRPDLIQKSVGEIEEWEVSKGGQGSGEHLNHPFRGNKWTSGLFNTAAHNEHPAHRLTPMHAHLNDAIGYQHAAMQALHEGRFGDAMRHFNKAAMHFGEVARKSAQGGKASSQTIHQKAAEGYAAAHHAGDMAEYASLKVNDFARAVRQGNDDPTTLTMLSAVAAEAQTKAHAAAGEVAGIASEFSRMRLSDAMAGAAQAAAS